MSSVTVDFRKVGLGASPVILPVSSGDLRQQIEQLRKSGKLSDKLQFATSTPTSGRQVVICSGERTRNQMLVYSGDDGWKSVYIRISPSGVRTENYKNNPVLLFLHGYGGAQHPVGTCNVYMSGGRLCGDLSFHGLTEDSTIVEQLWDAGVYRAVSQSVMVDWDSYEIDGDEIIFSGSELLEVSVVDVGADAKAIRMALNREGRNTMEDEIVDSGQGVVEPGVMSVQQAVEKNMAAYFADPDFMAGLSSALLSDINAAVEQLQNSVAEMSETIERQAQMIRALSGEPLVSKVTVPPFARPQPRETPLPPPPGEQRQATSVNRSRVSDAAVRRAGMIRN